MTSPSLFPRLASQPSSSYTCLNQVQRCGLLCHGRLLRQDIGFCQGDRDLGVRDAGRARVHFWATGSRRILLACSGEREGQEGCVRSRRCMNVQSGTYIVRTLATANHRGHLIQLRSSPTTPFSPNEKLLLSTIFAFPMCASASPGTV